MTVLGDILVLGVIALIVFSSAGLVALALCGMAGRTEREDEQRARFTRYGHEQRGWFA